MGPEMKSYHRVETRCLHWHDDIALQKRNYIASLWRDRAKHIIFSSRTDPF
jgi:hypothetical protein